MIFIFLFRREPCRSRASPASGLQVSAAYVAPQKVLIVNTNGGGHANIGFWLSKTLAGEEEEERCYTTFNSLSSTTVTRNVCSPVTSLRVKTCVCFIAPSINTPGKKKLRAQKLPVCGCFSFCFRNQLHTSSGRAMSLCV